VVCLSVGRSVIVVTRVPCKTAEPIEMPFEFCTLVCQRNHALNGFRFPIRRGNFMERSAHCKVKRLSAVSCTKAEPIKMQFEMWTRMGSRKHLLDGVQPDEYD